MKDYYIKIKAKDYNKMQNEIARLKARLEIYEPPLHFEPLLKAGGYVNDKHPFYKPGPKNALDELPDTFTKTFALEHGINQNQLKLWKARKYVTTSPDFSTYYKTELYKNRLWMATLTQYDCENNNPQPTNT